MRNDSPTSPPCTAWAGYSAAAIGIWLDLIDRADAILDGRDQNGPWNLPDLVPLRSACYVILGLTSGCRNHELASIEVGAVRQTTHDGEVSFWLKGDSLKTHCGTTEWMIPEIGMRCVQILERWAAPLREELYRQLDGIDRDFASMPRDSVRHTALLHDRRRLEADRHRLFLGRARGRIGCVAGGHWKRLMKSFARHLAVDWSLTTHQLRRTFAANVANHILGDLIYLKHHYKHWSLDMTALYAINAQQEQELFDDVWHAVREKKVRIIEHWVDADCMVIGGAAGPIKAFRAKHRLATVATRKKLAEDTSDLVNIRATGHGWCLASDAGCGGQGLYPPSCSSSEPTSSWPAACRSRSVFQPCWSASRATAAIEASPYSAAPRLAHVPDCCDARDRAESERTIQPLRRHLRQCVDAYIVR